MNGKLCAVKCEDIVTVFKLPTKSVIATYLIYLFPCIIGIVNCLFKKLLAVERKIFSCKINYLAIAALTQLKEERERRKQLECQTLIQRQQIAEMQPKASYYDLILQNKNTVPITQIAKDYGMSGRKFNELLHELGVQYKFRKTWLLYQQYAECGYTQSRTYAIDENRSVMHTYWTQKGRLFLYDLLKSEGILPVIEQED